MQESYLAFTTIMGGGSWFRDRTPEKAAKGLASTIANDWGSLFDVEGKTISCGIYRVDDQPVTMSHRGVFNKDTKEEIEMLEERIITIPKRRGSMGGSAERQRDKAERQRLRDAGL